MFVIHLIISFRVFRHHLRDDSFISRNLRGLLERGVQKSMDAGEPKGLVDPSTLPLAIETMLGYTGSIGTALWYEIGKDHGKVCRQCHGSIYDLTIVTLGF
jgi:hypothetical protein